MKRWDNRSNGSGHSSVIERRLIRSNSRMNHGCKCRCAPSNLTHPIAVQWSQWTHLVMLRSLARRQRSKTLSIGTRSTFKAREKQLGKASARMSRLLRLWPPISYCRRLVRLTLRSTAETMTMTTWSESSMEGPSSSSLRRTSVVLL